MSHDQITSIFDAWAREGRAEGMERAHGPAGWQVIEAADVRPGERILDLGCGNGWAARLLAGRAPRATAVGVDASREMIARAIACTPAGAPVTFRQALFEELPFEAGTFDRVFSMEALYYAVDLDRAVLEILRVLKPGGTADVVVDRYKERVDSEPWSRQVGLGMAWLGEAEWAGLFARHGFESVESSRVVDGRGPEDAATFVPDVHYPDFETRVAAWRAGSLHLGMKAPD